MSVVICELPKAGLGNQLFPLVKASVFAKLNGLPLVVVGYHQFRIGPYLRGEKSKRNYKGYFTFQKNVLAERIGRASLLQYKGYERVPEPPLERLPAEQKQKKKFIFSSIPHWNDYFAGLKEHRELAISLLEELISEDIRQRVAGLSTPVIGVHIRMGDFRKLQAGENFSKVGAVRTPEDYFVDIIGSIRKINGRELPVSVFTDGYQSEFHKLFSLENIRMIEGNADIVDMLLLSKSKLIVTSAGSTFSYWSGFLSDAPLIMHPDHIHTPVRSEQVNRQSYEGPFDVNNPDRILEKKILEISSF
jgi:Glycosyl transferase family 11